MGNTAVGLLLVMAIANFMGGSAYAFIEPQIYWRVENPFRLFADPADSRRHRATYDALSPQERRQPILAGERHLARRHSDGWAAALSGPVCWDHSINRYRCPTGSDASYVHPTFHRVEVWLSGQSDLDAVVCTWLTAPLGRDVQRGVALTQPCGRRVVLHVPYPEGADVSVEISGQTSATARIQVHDVFIVGLGDSYASGEGNPDVPVRFSPERSVDYGSPAQGISLEGYPARHGLWDKVGDADFIAKDAVWMDRACHRSLYSYQLRAALQLAIEDPHRAVTFLGFACSGAEITKGLFLRYRGNEWVPNPPDVSQISAVARAQCVSGTAVEKPYPEAYHMRGEVPELRDILSLHKCDREWARKIDLLLVSVGGNDIGFSRLVANAVLRDKAMLKRLGGWFGQVFTSEDTERPLVNIDARFKALNRALHNVLHVPWTESDRIILTAYPPLALLEDGRTPCPNGRAGMDVLPAFVLDSRRALAGEVVSQRLFEAMQRHARERGWSFATSHRETFLGHGICAGYRDVAVSRADYLRLPRKLHGYWDPYNPAGFKAYVSRKRWFRTPNDAFMTGNFHVTSRLLRTVLETNRLKWMQLLLAATYSGAFHPSAEGHAAIADAVADRARKVLERYGGAKRQMTLSR
ncbi:MAG: hypothetical protein ACR2PG_10135 [Hyphomicrobiaceae bacterium]